MPSLEEYPTSCSAKMLFYSCSAGKVDPILCVADEMKYICWETFLENFFAEWALSLQIGKKFFRTLDNL